jgi:hypothetical protein
MACLLILDRIENITKCSEIFCCRKNKLQWWVTKCELVSRYIVFMHSTNHSVSGAADDDEDDFGIEFNFG